MFIRIKECFYVTWEWTKTYFVLIYGVWKILRLPAPRITFFGGARFKPNTRFATSAHHIAKYLVANKVSVITGGGPGIMEAANCGATEAAKAMGKEIRSMGIGVKDLPKEKGINNCVQDFVMLDYVIAIKWLLMRYSKGLVIFPGGFGTADEMTELLTLIQTKKINRVPIILFGNEYWKPFMDWVINSAVKEGLISESEAKLLVVTEDEAEICSLLIKHCNACTDENN